jgi:hypothetical protein
MAHLPRDPRGYPIPWTVYRDAAGRAHFTINDEHRRLQCVLDKRCSICGERLFPSRLWFVGGPFSAFHERGAYLDPPMHIECARYSLQVCPYLALASYRGLISDRTLSADDPIGLVERTAMPDRPLLFVCALARDAAMLPSNVIVPARPFLRVEFWRHGARLTDAEGMRIARAELSTRPVEVAPDRIIRTPRR